MILTVYKKRENGRNHNVRKPRHDLWIFLLVLFVLELDGAIKTKGEAVRYEAEK